MGRAQHGERNPGHEVPAHWARGQWWRRVHGHRLQPGEDGRVRGQVTDVPDAGTFAMREEEPGPLEEVRDGVVAGTRHTQSCQPDHTGGGRQRLVCRVDRFGEHRARRVGDGEEEAAGQVREEGVGAQGSVELGDKGLQIGSERGRENVAGALMGGRGKQSGGLGADHDVVGEWIRQAPHLEVRA